MFRMKLQSNYSVRNVFLSLKYNSFFKSVPSFYCPFSREKESQRIKKQQNMNSKAKLSKVFIQNHDQKLPKTIIFYSLLYELRFRGIFLTFLMQKLPKNQRPFDCNIRSVIFLKTTALSLVHSCSVFVLVVRHSKLNKQRQLERAKQLEILLTVQSTYQKLSKQNDKKRTKFCQIAECQIYKFD